MGDANAQLPVGAVVGVVLLGSADPMQQGMATGSLEMLFKLPRRALQVLPVRFVYGGEEGRRGRETNGGL